MLEVRTPKEAVMAQNWEVESVDTAVMVIIKQIRWMALDRGYEWQIRFKKVNDRKEARKQETKFLKKYNNILFVYFIYQWQLRYYQSDLYLSVF